MCKQRLRCVYEHHQRSKGCRVQSLWTKSYTCKSNLGEKKKSNDSILETFFLLSQRVLGIPDLSERKKGSIMRNIAISMTIVLVAISMTRLSLHHLHLWNRPPPLLTSLPPHFWNWWHAKQIKRTLGISML